ncbi:MAG: hypothetical protein H7X95_10795 [Deltaproteobacteria bacterium]|nr:hypothetical protein [Deltaproteobacteria bacterium]
MIRIKTTLLVGALLMVGLAAEGCSKKGGAPRDTPPGPRPGDVDCYKTTGAAACLPDPTDPTGMKLPTPGAACTLPPCGVCGSANAPAFRDSVGVAKTGWCICIAKSDDSGARVYSCFGVNEWQSR